jgi:predicted  nucleic acid-binding Zn-ribbon protein
LDSAFDPWAKAKPSTTSAGDSRPRLDEIKDQLCQDIKSKVSKDIESTAQEVIKAAASSSSQAAQTDEKRLQALEVGMQELKGQNAQMSTWFQQAGERMQANENALGAVQHTLNAHQHEIHTLGTTFQSTMKTIKNDLSTEMTDSFNKQLSRLEALLEKKQRSS